MYSNNKSECGELTGELEAEGATEQDLRAGSGDSVIVFRGNRDRETRF